MQTLIAVCFNYSLLVACGWKYSALFNIHKEKTYLYTRVSIPIDLSYFFNELSSHTNVLIV